jgi:hypothetical protein
VTIGLGYLVNAVDVPVMLPNQLDGSHGHSPIAWACVAALGLALARQLWKWGLGPWLEILGGHHTHEHGEGHHHGHGHGHHHGQGTTTTMGTITITRGAQSVMS